VLLNAYSVYSLQDASSLVRNVACGFDEPDAPLPHLCSWCLGPRCSGPRCTGQPRSYCRRTG